MVRPVALLDAPIVAGFVLALSLTALPGPVNALIATAAASRGFWTGWRVGLGAALGDLTLLALTALGVLRLVDAAPWLGVAFAGVGSLLMFWFAVDAWRSARRPAREAGGPATLARSYVLVVLSPLSWAWWLTAGSAMLTMLGLWVVAGFFAGLVAWAVVWSFLAASGARVRRFSEFVGYAAAVVLVGFGVAMAWAAVMGARGLS